MMQNCTIQDSEPTPLRLTDYLFLSRYEELIALVPEEVKGDYYCQELLESLSEIAEYMCSVGPKRMSRRKLIQVLATLDPWELQAPDIEGAVKVRAGDE